MCFSNLAMTISGIFMGLSQCCGAMGHNACMEHVTFYISCQLAITHLLEALYLLSKLPAASTGVAAVCFAAAAALCLSHPARERDSSDRAQKRGREIRPSLFALKKLGPLRGACAISMPPRDR